MIFYKFQAFTFMYTLAKYLVLHDLILFLTFPNKLARLSLSMSMVKSNFLKAKVGQVKLDNVHGKDHCDLQAKIHAV